MNPNRSRRWPLLSLLLMCCAVAPACAAGPDPTFVLAARDTLNAVAPEYLRYVDSDPALSQEQRDRRHRTIGRFEEAIKSREVRQ